MDKLADFKGEIVHSGQHPGIPAQQIPLWEIGNNVLFADQSVKVAPTQAPLYEKLSSLPGTGILAVNNGGKPALIWANRQQLFRGLTQPSSDDVTRYTATPGDDPYTGTDADLWSFVQFGQSILATNGVDEIQYLADVDTTPNFVNFSTVADIGSGFRCQILRKTGSFIIAYNTNNIDSEYRWCDEDDLTTWLPSAENKARDINIRELASFIVAVVPMGRTHLVYGHDQVFIVQFTGVPFYFGHNHLLTGIGAVGKSSVCSVGRRNFGFGPNGIFIVDGMSYQYIDTPSIHRYIYEQNYDSDRSKEVVAWADANEEVAYFSVPGVTEDFTVGFNWRTGAWAVFEWYRKAADSGGMWKHPVLIDGGGQSGLGGQPWIQSSTSAPYTAAGVPLGLTDEMSFVSGYGYLGYGEAAYGGVWDGFEA